MKNRHFAARHFNIVTEISDDVVLKKSSDLKKLLSEAVWLRESPFPKKATLIHHQHGSLWLKNYKGWKNLAEEYFDTNPGRRLEARAMALEIGLSHFSRPDAGIQCTSAELKELYVFKTVSRMLSLQQSCPAFLGSSEVVINDQSCTIPSPWDIEYHCFGAGLLSPHRSIPGHWHGDAAFSNILVSPDLQEYVFIDPRGPLTGDKRYDLAKLCHSIMYCYESFAWDEFNFKEVGPSEWAAYPDRLGKAGLGFIEALCAPDRRIEIKLICALQFMSMASLHYKDNPFRAKALFLWGVLAYNDVVKEIEAGRILPAQTPP